MKAEKRRFSLRQFGERRYRKLFVIATEGQKTEPEYFEALRNEQSVIHFLKANTGSAPLQILKKMQQYLKKEGLKSSDEAWLVVDRDHWSEAQLDQLHTWSKKEENFGLALSNPKFEYWLLLHFEDASGVATSKTSSERLRRYLPEYDKGIDPRKITMEMIMNAIQRAEHRDRNRNDDWPRKTGTTVYLLVRTLLATALALD